MSEIKDQVTVQTRQQGREWLTEHHAASPGIWLATYCW